MNLSTNHFFYWYPFSYKDSQGKTTLYWGWWNLEL